MRVLTCIAATFSILGYVAALAYFGAMFLLYLKVYQWL